MKYNQGLKTKVFKINAGFITQKIDGKVTIFEGEKSTLHTLNESAAFIFQGLKLGWDDKKIIKGLIRMGAAPDDAEGDLADFKQLLLKKGIIIESSK